MNITNEQYQKIIRFLDADMEQDEMDAFEKELASHPEMRKQLDFEQSLRDEFMLQGIDHLPGTVAANESLPVSATPGKITRMQKWIAIGAAVVTAVTLLTIFWQKPGKNPDVADRKHLDAIDTAQKTANSPETAVTALTENSSGDIDLALLFKQYFKKDALPENYPLYLAEAFTDYEAGNYTTLQKLNLNDLPQTRGVSETDSKENILQLGHYYKGLAFLQTGNTRDAITNLYWVLNNQPGKALQAKAQWYLALAYLKENNSEKATELCRSIVNNKENNILVKNAEKILDVVGK
ncbi:MAG: tetratricopeptide repeat protein [Chitinophagaceae bacterium]|nr:tetratricopeptide repeat protein [Chitinophagaceae bacterium]